MEEAGNGSAGSEAQETGESGGMENCMSDSEDDKEYGTPLHKRSCMFHAYVCAAPRHGDGGARGCNERKHPCQPETHCRGATRLQASAAACFPHNHMYLLHNGSQAVGGMASSGTFWRRHRAYTAGPLLPGGSPMRFSPLC